MPHTTLRRYLRHGMFPQLMVFEAVARLGSFTRAAQELFMAQPTVSIHMKKLAETIGVPLVEQVGKRIHLTDAGRELHAMCREVFVRLQEFDRRLGELREPGKGRLRVAVTTTAKYFASRLLGEFCNRYPELHVTLHVLNRQQLLERMEVCADDLYVLGSAPDGADWAVHPLLPNPLRIVAPAGHPLAGRRRVPLATVAAEPLLLRESGSGTRQAVEEHFRAHGLVPRVRMELGSNEAIKQAVLGGLGLAVLSSESVSEARQGGLAILDVEGFPLARHWVLVHPAGRTLTPTAREFVQFAVEHGRRLSAQEGAAAPPPAARRARRKALSSDQKF